MIQVTKSFLPPFDEYTEYLRGIWERNQLTNNGPLVQKLEADLKDYLGVKHLFFLSNGTIALQIAIKALGLKGEVITTPFSYVASTSTIVWENCEPVFVDIDPNTYCINPDLIEAAITPRTVAILAVHVYGYPAQVERLQEIADRHGLKVIYDSAHAFGTTYKGHSVLRYGDVNALSFHATKLFHTVEGGALITQDDELAHVLEYMRRFGHNGPEDFWGLGINGKNSEFHAAMGLCVLPHVPEIVENRKTISRLYDFLLAETGLQRITLDNPDVVFNYAYYPVVFESEEQLLNVLAKLNANQIFPRRYFYPSLNTIPYVKGQSAPVSESIARRVACLPLYHDLSNDEVYFIAETIKTGL